MEFDIVGWLKMKIAILCERDLSGILYSFYSALKRHSYEANFVKSQINPRLKYPTHHLKSDVNVNEIVDDSDVLVLKASRGFFNQYKLDFNKMRDKQIVMIFGRKYMKKHHLRKPILNKLKKYNNIKFMTTSIDYADDKIKWFTPCVRVDELREKYGTEKQVPTMVMASPSYSTNLQFKVAIKFNMIVSTLKKEGLEFRHVLYTGNIPNNVCLKTKAKASIFFDRIGDGVYGVNSQEASALGCAVVTGASMGMLNRLTVEGFYCPFDIAKNVGEATRHIKELLTNEVAWDVASNECYQYVREVHSGDETVKRFLEVIE